MNLDTWAEYAKLLQETGVDGLELNFYWTLKEFARTAQTSKRSNSKSSVK